MDTRNEGRVVNISPGHQIPNTLGDARNKRQARKAQSCYIAYLRSSLGVKSKAQQAEETKTVCIDPDHPKKATYVCVELKSMRRVELVQFLTRRRLTFPRSHDDMKGINSVIMHNLNVDPAANPIQQKRRRFSQKFKQ